MPDSLLDFLRAHEEAFRSRARLASLYSDFRHQRTTNPDGYLANSGAWLRALSAAADAGLLPSQSSAGTASPDRFVLHSGDTLASALQTPDLGRPLALGAVLHDAVGRKELIPQRAFLDGKQSIYARRWVPTPWEVASWGLRKLGVLGEGGGGDEERLVRGDYVIVAIVEAAAKAVLAHAQTIGTSNTSRIFSRDLFQQTFASAIGDRTLSENDLSALLTHLSRDRQAISYSATSGVIKFPSFSTSQPAPITEEDISIASLRTLIASLNPQISTLTSQISILDAEARSAVAQKRLPAAKTALRQKKALEARLSQRSATLAQLEDVYAKIEQAADNVEMVAVLSAASTTLKSLNRQTGGAEKVADVMDGLREEMLTADEIGAALNEASAGAVDEAEVEDELEALEQSAKAETKDKEEKVQERKDEQKVEETRQRLAELDGLGEKASALETDAAEKESEQMKEAVGA